MRVATPWRPASAACARSRSARTASSRSSSEVHGPAGIGPMSMSPPSGCAMAAAPMSAAPTRTSGASSGAIRAARSAAPTPWPPGSMPHTIRAIRI